MRRPHGLRLARAKRLAEAIAGRLRDQYGGSYAWEGNTLHFNRTGASGHVTVTRERFEVLVEIGWLLRPFQGIIEREIQAFCDQHLGKSGTPVVRNSVRVADEPSLEQTI